MYTYSFIMCIEFHVACMQTNFSEGTTPCNRLSRLVCSMCSFTSVSNKSKNPNLKKTCYTNWQILGYIFTTINNTACAPWYSTVQISNPFTLESINMEQGFLNTTHKVHFLVLYNCWYYNLWCLILFLQSTDFVCITFLRYKLLCFTPLPHL